MHTLHRRSLLLQMLEYCSRSVEHIGVSKGKASPYSTAERRVPELIPVRGSQPAGDVSHKPDGRLPLLSARPAVTPATLKRAAMAQQLASCRAQQQASNRPSQWRSSQLL